ncbi:hypothetical protein JHK86_023739 [Glycine max]|nr:hypothetical protein JHK86_023739 [Glycine max]
MANIMFLDTCQDGTDQTERGGLEIGRKRKGRYLFLNKRITYKFNLICPPLLKIIPHTHQVS